MVMSVLSYALWVYDGLEEKMNEVMTWIMFILMAIMGGTTTIYLIIALPAVIIWKIYRAIRYGYKLTD